VRLLAVRLLAVLVALTWLVFPGFGLVDLSVSWDPDWSVVLEAGWGLFMTVLIGGAFLALAVRPGRPAAPAGALLLALAAMVVSSAIGLEAPLLGYAGVLFVEGLGLAALLRRLPGRESLRPQGWSVRWPLLVVAGLGVVPWLRYAHETYADNRRNAGISIGDVTMGVDHYALQGGLAVALAALAVLAAVWPGGRLYAGISVGLCAGYLGLVSFAFPGTWAGFGPLTSALCMAWGVAVAVLALVPGTSEQRELRGEVVEAQRAL
jgi:hypothetical protein